MAKDLAAYLRTIMPSTPSAAVEVDRIHGVRVAPAGELSYQVLLTRGYWTSHPRPTIRVPSTETYPMVTTYLAFMVCGPMIHAAYGVPPDASDQATLDAWNVVRAPAQARLREAHGYLQQVAADASTPPRALDQARRALDSVDAYIAELRGSSRST